ncbi:hypothetical protein BB560_005331 [Smittium megazygosporum]|uniref:Alpha-1,3-mannosyltransferase CMT1 n=1 Tax=Smittium megazygosporum TaxID=133381 RepID=A0A2T9Z6T0_9FUNG|nr:hypothetical protein BB560_005331 [Smittium megazygosporum]
MSLKPRVLKRSLAVALLTYIAFLFYIYQRNSAYNTVPTPAVKTIHDYSFAPLCNTVSRIKVAEAFQASERYAYLEQKPSITKEALKIIGKGPKKYYFSSNFVNNQEVLPHLFSQLLSIFKFLGPENVFFSIFENSSTDNTTAIIRDFEKKITELKIRHSFVSSKHKRPNPFHRIEYLAGVRNRAMEPLYKEQKLGFTYDKIVFLNDVFFCENDLLELLYQSDFQGADITCPMDVVMYGGNGNRMLGFRDSWVARDISGDRHHKNFSLGIRDEETNKRYHDNLPFQVQCCWNGIAIINSAPFYQENPIKFRRSDIVENECSASECSLFCNDMWNRDFGKIITVPRIKVSYNQFDQIAVNRGLNLTPVADKEAERITYIGPPEKIVCVGLNGVNKINPDSGAIWVTYLKNKTHSD